MLARRGRRLDLARGSAHASLGGEHMAEVVQPLGDAELADLAYLIAHAQ